MKSANYVIITRNNRYTGYKHYLYTAEDDRGDYMEWTLDRNKATEIDRLFAKNYVEDMNNFGEEKYTFDIEFPTNPEPIETDVAGEACDHVHFEVDYFDPFGEPVYTCMDCGMLNDGHGWYYEAHSWMQEEE